MKLNLIEAVASRDSIVKKHTRLGLVDAGHGLFRIVTANGKRTDPMTLFIRKEGFSHAEGRPPITPEDADRLVAQIEGRALIGGAL